jgi:hypothetical protein
LRTNCYQALENSIFPVSHQELISDLQPVFDSAIDQKICVTLYLICIKCLAFEKDTVTNCYNKEINNCVSSMGFLKRCFPKILRLIFDLQKFLRDIVDMHSLSADDIIYFLAKVIRAEFIKYIFIGEGADNIVNTFLHLSKFSDRKSNEKIFQEMRLIDSKRFVGIFRTLNSSVSYFKRGQKFLILGLSTTGFEWISDFS